MALSLKRHDTINIEIEKKVISLLKDGWTENEVVALLKMKQVGKRRITEERIIYAIANVSKDSSVVCDYCKRVLVPEIKELIETKHTVGQIHEIMNKNHYQILVDEALCMSLSGLYLV